MVLHYAKTTGGDELLTRTLIISEELEQERVKKRKKVTIPSSDEPGTYDEATLTAKLGYLSRKQVTNQRILEVFLPILLSKKTVTRTELKAEYQKQVPEGEVSKVGYYMAMISGQLGRDGNDFLRQVIAYEYPNHTWEKDNLSLREEYRQLARDIVTKLGQPQK